MKWLNRLSQAIKGNSEKEQQKQQIREAMLAAVRDGVITNDELRQIIDLCNNSQLTYEELYHIRVEAFHAAVNLAISDRRITDAEEKSLHHIHAALQLPNEVFADAASKIYKYRQLYELERGNLVCFPANNIMLKPGENCHWFATAILIEERVVSRRTVGSSRGVSVRIMKGVSYRIGSSKGQLISETGLVPVTSGVLYVTNKRMVYSGERKSFEIPYNKLIDMELYSDGMKFSVTNRQKPYIFRTSRIEDIEAIGLLLSYAADGRF
jgi:hypothetical protein